jgi:hypothetical protein
MNRARALLGLSLLALAAAPAPTRADEVIPPKVLTRKFPQNTFCALPVQISFTAPGTPVAVTFTAIQFVDDGSGQFVFTDQAIDNVTVATTAQVAANTDPPPPFSQAENCYIGDPEPVSYFHFNRPGLTFDLLERFDDDPAARGWDLSQGGWFVAGRSAPRDVETVTDINGGSVVLGDGSGTPGPGPTASASITVSGLSEGVSYDLCAWWSAGFVRFPHDVDYLTITITTVNGTPVAQRSWGGLKSQYRR